MEIDLKAILTGVIFFGGVKAIQAATEWCKKFFPGDAPKWFLALMPVVFGLLINCGTFAALGYYKEFGTMAIVASIIAGFVSAFAAMALYDDRVAK